MKRVLIIGGGFAGLNAAKQLGNIENIEVTILDKSNHHLFQPLIYQVAMAGLNPSDVAVPIRSIVSKYNNIKVLYGEALGFDFENNIVKTDFYDLGYDYLIIAAGARHSYFGNDQWAEFAPGLKSLDQATEIRRKVLTAFENAEKSKDKEEQRKLLTFVVVGGGPTGVELAGAIGEMSRFTLSKDFKNIDSKLSRIILIEGGSKILPSFCDKLSSRAVRDLESVGVQVWTNSLVTSIDQNGVCVGNEKIMSSTVLWAAGVQASSLTEKIDIEKDRIGRLVIEQDLSLKGIKNVFAAGDIAHYKDEKRGILPGIAPVAVQQGKHIGEIIKNETAGQPRTPFKYFDKGQMATIGRSKAIVEFAGLKFSGFFAWLAWLFVHILYLTGFKNRTLVVLQWGWQYLTFKRGSRLILGKCKVNKDNVEINTSKLVE